MPRVKRLKGEIGTTGRVESVDVSRGSAYAIGEAVDLEHWGCSDNHCDIHAALENGFVFSAASLLIGATETPLLDRVVSYFNIDLISPSDWIEWLAYFQSETIQCENCGEFCFAESGDYCDNCAAVLR